jgi:hypothetical protein
VWCGVVWCGVVWCGVVWCGVVWCGVVWCGVVWCGNFLSLFLKLNLNYVLKRQFQDKKVLVGIFLFKVHEWFSKSTCENWDPIGPKSINHRAIILITII